MADWENDKEEIHETARLIGYQVARITTATEVELDQWEACVSWARSGAKGPCPHIPMRIVRTYNNFRFRSDRLIEGKQKQHGKRP